MNAEQGRHLLAQAVVPDEQLARLRRGFTKAQRSALARLGCTPAQIERLQRMLPHVAYFCETGPRLADTSAPLDALAADTRAAAASLRALLDAPGHELARGEARGWLLHALAMQRVSSIPYIPYDKMEDEARRLLAAIDDVATAAKRAHKRLPKAQTRPVAHWYPLALIDAALSVDGPPVKPSASADSAFRKIAGISYSAARAENADPLRAIRSYLKERESLEALLPRNGSPKN